MVDIRVDVPDFFGAAQRGIASGRATNEYVRGNKTREEVDALAPSIMGGDTAAYERAAVIDKPRADEYQSEHVKRLKQLDAGITYMEEALASKDPLRIAAAWSGGTRPLLATIIKDKPIPEEWSDDMIPAMMKAKAMVQGVQADDKGPGGRVQSRFTNDKGEVMLVMGDNRVVNTGEKAAPNIKILEQEGQVPQGYVTSGGKAGEAVQLGGGQPTQAGTPAAQAPPVQGANPNEGVVTSAANAMIAAGVPEAQVDAWVKSQLSADVTRTAPAGTNLQTSQIVTGGPARTPTSAEKKRDETAATGTMQTLSADEVAANGLPEGTFAQRNSLTGEIKVGPAAAQKAPGGMTAKQAADMKLKAGKAKSALVGTFADLDRMKAAATRLKARAGIDRITGLQGMLPNIPGGEAANTEADLEALKSQIGFAVLQKMRQNSPTGGALGNVSDKEGARLEANLAALDKSQSPEQMRRRLQDVIDYVESSKEALNSAYDEQFSDLTGSVGEEQGAPAAGGTVWTRDANGKLVRGN